MRQTLFIAVSIVTAVAFLAGDAWAQLQSPNTGQYARVRMDFAGQQNQTDPTLVDIDINTSYSDRPGSSGGLYASARATPGSVGAEASLSYANGGDVYYGYADAQSAEFVTVSSPSRANQTIQVMLGAAPQGGLGIGGTDSEASARAYFQIQDATFVNPTFGQIFNDRAHTEDVYNSETGQTTYNQVYNYSGRVTQHPVNLALDATGNGSFWVALYLDVDVNETGSFFRPNSGAASADYRHTITAYLQPTEGGTTISTASGWQVLPVPEPSTALLLFAALPMLGLRPRCCNKKTRQ